MLPIEKANNIGPTVGAELRACGIATIEELSAHGWQESWARLCTLNPARIHLVCGYALLGAELALDYRDLTPVQQDEVRREQRRIRRAISPA